jgi:hypothetical protein
VRALTRADFDLLDFAASQREFKKTVRNWSSTAPRSTTVADAQKNPDLAWRRECDVTRLLAGLASETTLSFSPPTWCLTAAGEITMRPTR